MTLSIVIYIFLLIVFLGISGLIIRHTIKFGYLSPDFKKVVIVFGVLSIIVIIYSIYVLTLFGKPAESGYDYYEEFSEPATTGELNF